METQNGNWIQSDTKIGAPNGTQLGVKSQLSNKRDFDVVIDSSQNVSPNQLDPHGLSANTLEGGVNRQEQRIIEKGKPGGIGSITIGEIRANGLLASPDPKDPTHYLIQPGDTMPFTEYQKILNSLPWRAQRRF